MCLEHPLNTKSSTTLRFLETHEVFTLDEFLESVDPTVGQRTRYLNLQNAVKRDQATRLKHGLYASNLGTYRDRVPNPLLVASKSAPGAVLAYHSALEAHGVAHTPARTLYFTADARIRSFTARGYRFRQVSAPRGAKQSARLAEHVSRARVGDSLVAVTSRERTVVDCLARLDLAGGLEELLRSVGGFTTVSAQGVAEYTHMLASPTYAARAGWLVSMMRDEWHPADEPLEGMRRSLGRGTFWLERRRAGQEYVFVREWRLYVPAEAPLREWLAG
jgi:predicted transcriptional regulator of viral defense system